MNKEKLATAAIFTAATALALTHSWWKTTITLYAIIGAAALYATKAQKSND